MVFWFLFSAFVVLPDRKWVLETGREYEVLIEVYDKNSHRLHPSDVSKVSIKAMFITENITSHPGRPSVKNEYGAALSAAAFREMALSYFGCWQDEISFT